MARPTHGARGGVGGMEVTDTDRARIEQAIADAQLGAYQAMVVRNTAESWSVTAALNWIEAMGKEASDGATVTA